MKLNSQIKCLCSTIDNCGGMTEAPEREKLLGYNGNIHTGTRKRHCSCRQWSLMPLSTLTYYSLSQKTGYAMNFGKSDAKSIPWQGWLLGCILGAETWCWGWGGVGEAPTGPFGIITLPFDKFPANDRESHKIYNESSNCLPALCRASSGCVI